MDVKPGYKQTGLGVLPTDWDVAPLGRLATFRTGPFGSALHKSDYTDDGVPVVNPMHIVGGKIEPTRTMTITEQAARRLSDFRMSPGQIVIGRRGDMGRCAVIQQHHAGWLCGTGSMIVRPLNADPDFLQRVLSSPRAISAIEDSSVGTTMVNLNQGTLAGLMVQLPPLSEQRLISAALCDVDDFLDGLDRLIAKKRDLKQAAMQQLLTGQTRLPGFSGDWEVRRLGEAAQIVMGQSPSSSNYNTKGMGLPLIQGNADIVNRLTIKRTFTTLITKHGRTGDILMSVRAPVGEISRAAFDVCLGRGVCAIRFPNGFLYHCLIYLEPSWAKHSKGSTFDSVNSADVSAAEIRIPSDLAEQTAIAAVLSDMDAELSALEARRDKTRALKQGMMQELLTGRIRLISREDAKDARQRVD
ncbi:MAG: restriction endonuclease subunit S [Acidobacteriota bacterium]|nr:restriction endonuclease subunit S [Acidobacteriota bacterium]